MTAKFALNLICRLIVVAVFGQFKPQIKYRVGSMDLTQISLSSILHPKAGVAWLWGVLWGLSYTLLFLVFRYSCRRRIFLSRRTCTSTPSIRSRVYMYARPRMFKTAIVPTSTNSITTIWRSSPWVCMRSAFYPLTTSKP